jgi:hypothetical protein
MSKPSTPALEAPPCQGPDPHPRAPRFRMPRGACDCYAHVIGSPERYPFTAERSYTPPLAPEEAYLAMHRALGIERGVLVQVSAHGADNLLLADARQRARDPCRRPRNLPSLAGSSSFCLRLETLVVREGRTHRSIRMSLSLAFLDPNIVVAAVEGRQPRGCGLTRLVDPPMARPDQRQSLGLQPHARSSG